MVYKAFACGCSRGPGCERGDDGEGGSLFWEPVVEENEDWKYVGRGQGSYHIIDKYKYVGDGAGSFDPEGRDISRNPGGGCRRLVGFACCLVLVVLGGCAGYAIYAAANGDSPSLAKEVDQLAARFSTAAADVAGAAAGGAGADEGAKSSGSEGGALPDLASVVAAGQGEAALKHDCSMDGDPAGWSPVKRDWCCKHAGAACEEFDCEIGDLNHWPAAKCDWCCRTSQKGCHHASSAQ